MSSCLLTCTSSAVEKGPALKGKNLFANKFSPLWSNFILDSFSEDKDSLELPPQKVSMGIKMLFTSMKT